MGEFTPEEIERVDLTTSTLGEKIEMCPHVYACAPAGDGLSRRQWTAQRLGVPIGVVNKTLWRLGHRWFPPGEKRFTKRGRLWKNDPKPHRRPTAGTEHHPSVPDVPESMNDFDKLLEAVDLDLSVFAGPAGATPPEGADDSHD
jgi:hypothetical protein